MGPNREVKWWLISNSCFAVNSWTTKRWFVGHKRRRFFGQELTSLGLFRLQWFCYEQGLMQCIKVKIEKLGSGCGSVGRVVASNTRGPRFESSHRQKFTYILNICLLSTMYWKDKNKEKETGNGPFKKRKCEETN